MKLKFGFGIVASRTAKGWAMQKRWKTKGSVWVDGIGAYSLGCTWTTRAYVPLVLAGSTRLAYLVYAPVSRSLYWGLDEKRGGGNKYTSQTHLQGEQTHITGKKKEGRNRNS